MTKALGPGMCVVCVDASGLRHPESRLTQGAIYFCEDVEEMVAPCPRDGCGTAGVLLKDKGELWYCSPDCAGHRFYYCPNHFAPLDDGDTSKADGEVILTIHSLDGSPPVTFPLDIDRVDIVHIEIEEWF